MSVFFRTPPGRYYGLPNEISNEGILYQDFNKSNLQETSHVLYWSSSANVYWYGWSRWRRFDDSYQYAMEKGNYKAWEYGDKIHLDFIARNCGTPTASIPIENFCSISIILLGAVNLRLNPITGQTFRLFFYAIVIFTTREMFIA